MNFAFKVFLALSLISGLFFLLQATGSNASSNASAGNKVGSIAPGFELTDLQGKTVKLSDFSGKNVILFFNEGGMCYPSCWNQIKELANDKRLNNESTASFSIVTDKKSDWDKIVSEVPGFSGSGLLFDTARRVSSAFGALTMPSSMHNGMMPGHTYYIIGTDGKIKFIFDDPKMGIRNELLAEEILKLE